MFETCRMLLWYRARPRGPTQEEEEEEVEEEEEEEEEVEEEEDMVNDFLLLQQQAQRLVTHTVNEQGIIVKIKK